ncbi:antirepressor AbbA [Thermaerobacillus caldiproteolyticus]|uniref:Antirepressor AbbA n=1 Tax=Thermaerobacillus caldiproteolyticus TaxID=247480 RepID=A0A7V9Z522_9BACL|nr:antirepressor AbbA [Anoxybacillus caldiproteolyticus]MBA2874169.1 hypothetical protein [Anoxybacillus caldiproteolyticus]
MDKQLLEQLTPEEQKLLLDVLFTQHYALELISCELADIENGNKQVEEERYKQLMHLYYRIREETM